MRRSLIISFLICILSFSVPVIAESWDDIPNLDNAWDGQKTITNQEFEEVMDALQAKQKKKEEKKKKKTIKKISGGGDSLHQDMNPDKVKNNEILKANKDGFLLNVPVNMILDNDILDKGYYQVIVAKEKNQKIYMNFYQAHYFKGKIEATETEDDFDEENIDFAKIVSYNDSFIKVIYGSIDFNAYAYIPYYTEQVNNN